MSTEIHGTPIGRSARGSLTGNRPVGEANIGSSYEGSNAVFRLLQLGHWGPGLMNLGAYRFRGPVAFMNLLGNLEAAQQRLVLKAAKLLDVQAGERVLDVACGRGKSSYMLNGMHPEAVVVGLDLLDINIQVSRALFQGRNLTYVAGSAMDLDFPDESFDRVMCLEAAFHFPDRSRFLHEAHRVLRPGGRLVVIDFAWNTDADRERVDHLETRVVREVWQWDDLFSLSDYERGATQAGFSVEASRDWSHCVTRPIQKMFHFVSRLGNSAWGRRVLAWHNPLYRSLTIDEWKQLAHIVTAHDYVHRYSKYMAFVFDKC